MVARGVEEVSTLGRIEIKEDARHHDDLLLEEQVEEAQSIQQRFIRQRRLQGREVEPDVERAVRDILAAGTEPNLPEALEDVVPLHLEMSLQRNHLRVDFGRIQHANRGLLERHIGAAVEIASARSQRFDELLGADNPGYTPTGQTETFGQAIDEEDVVMVDIEDVARSGDGRAVAVMIVSVARVEFVEDERCPVTADVLDFGKLLWVERVTSWVTRVRSQYDRGAAGELFGYLVGVDVVAVGGRERRWDRHELWKVN